MVKIARGNQGGMLSLQWDSLYFKHLQPVALSLTLSDYFHLGESDQMLFIRALDPDYIVLACSSLIIGSGILNNQLLREFFKNLCINQGRNKIS